MVDKLLGSPYNLREANFMQTSLSSGMEDYIELIYLSTLKKEQLKGADLARKLDISRASVSEVLAKLTSKKLIIYNENKTISLTTEGKKEAKKVYSKHHILKTFFETVLNIPSETAEENACKIEHIISKQILNRMETFTKFFQSHKKILDLYIEESEK